MSVFGSGFGFGGGGSPVGSITGLGTINKVPKYTAADVIGDSQISDNGTTVFVGASASSTSAIFEVKSTTKGSLFPRMTTVERDLIAVGATSDSLFIYNTTARDYQYYDHVALAWVSISSAAPTLYSSDGTTGAGRVVTLTDTLAFNDGQVTIKGAGATNATKAFSVTNSTPTEKFYVRDDGAVNVEDGLWKSGTKYFHTGASTIYNVFLGASAGLSNTAAGRDNFAVGTLCFNSATDADDNIAIGNQSQYVNVSGDGNIALGNSTLRQTVSPANCVAIGSYAGYGNISFSTDNVFIGVNSGRNISTSNYNTFLGASKTALVMPNVSYSITLGYDVASTADRQAVIGGTTGYINDMYLGSGVSQTAITPTEFKMQITSITAGQLDTASGYDYVIASSQGTGTGAGGDIIFETAPIGGSGTAQNALVTMMTIAGSGNITMAGLTDSSLFTTDYANDKVGIGVAPTFAKLQIQGAGATSATTSLLVENSSGDDTFACYDDRTSVFNRRAGASFGAAGVVNLDLHTSSAYDVGYYVYMNNNNNGAIGMKVAGATSGFVGGTQYGVSSKMNGFDQNNIGVYGASLDIANGGSARTQIGVYGRAYTNTNVISADTLIGGKFVSGGGYAGTQATVIGVLSAIDGTSGNVTMTDVTGYDFDLYSFNANDTITTLTGIKIDVGTVGTVTNRYAATFMNGNVGIGTTSPTGYLHIGAGTATASTSPLKFTTGTLNTSAETGAMEFASDFFYLTANAIRTAISTYGRTVVSTATYSALVTDRIIGVTRTATGVCTVNLASAALYPSGYPITIKDEGLNASTYNITIDGSASQTIDGALTKLIIVDGDSLTIYSNGVDAWFIK